MSETPTPDQYGTYQIAIRNTSGQVILAAQVYHQCPNGNTDVIGFDDLATDRLALPHGVSPATFGPGVTHTFDVLERERHCSGGVRVLFQDGHCEQSVAGKSLCEDLLAEDHNVLDELKHLSAAVATLPTNPDGFTTALAALLHARRDELSDQDRRMSRESTVPRTRIVDQMLSHIIPSYSSTPAEFTSAERMLALLDAW